METQNLKKEVHQKQWELDTTFAGISSTKQKVHEVEIERKNLASKLKESDQR